MDIMVLRVIQAAPAWPKEIGDPISSVINRPISVMLAV